MTLDQEDEIEHLQVSALNRQGKGVISVQGKHIEVPFALPGDTVILNKKTQTVTKVIQTSTIRKDPFCKYFTKCGGCSMQSLADKEYKEWKRDSLISDFAASGITIKAEDIMEGYSARQGSRRRASISYRNRGGILSLGFNEANRNWVMDIDYCPLLQNKINSCFNFLRKLLQSVTHNGNFGHAEITEAENGIDIFLHISPKSKVGLFFQEEFLTPLRTEGHIYNIIKVSCSKGVIFFKEEPLVRFGTSQIPFLSGGFLQASKHSEEAMVAFIKEQIQDQKNLRILDLFSGQGSISIPLAEDGHLVSACDINKKAIPILENLSATKNLNMTIYPPRDLFRNPFSTEELSSFDLVILDPPRAGAKEQIMPLCASQVPVLAYVSCSSKTLAADSAMLLANNFELTKIATFDQFPYTEHLETIAVFKKVEKHCL